MSRADVSLPSVLSISPGSARAWLVAARPATLTAALTPVLVGSACAEAAGGFAWVPALSALLGAFCLQIASNFANDVFDFEKGADTAARLGPTRAVQAGLLSPLQMRRGLFVILSIAVLFGLHLTWLAGPSVVVIGIASILAALAYTAGPFPLGYNGLGDLFVMVFFGFVAVCGTAFVQLGYLPSLAIVASLPVGAIATAVLVVNNVRDRETDVTVGKKTLAVRFGANAALGEYVGLLALAYVTPAAMWALGLARVPVLLPWLTLPLALGLLREVKHARGSELNHTLVGTARLLLFFGLLFAAGIVAS